MSTLSDLVSRHGSASDEAIERLHEVSGDAQLLADLAFADIVLWAPTLDGSFVAIAHTRPGGAATLFYRDIVGDFVRPQWQAQVRAAFESGDIVDSSSPEWFEETPTRVRAVPVTLVVGSEGTRIGVVTRHTNLGDVRAPSRQQLTFNECADDIFRMMAQGDFPDGASYTGPRRGAPRASDGLIRLDERGIVTFASPNALSAFNRMGFDDELEGEILGEVTSEILPIDFDTDERLPIVMAGKAAWRAEIESRGVTISVRAIPLKNHGARFGAVLLIRDVSELRSQEQELITKDATIREIHHRVKNNLQTVASLLRIQARRTPSDEARESLLQAMQRVAAIAVVHDTLSEGLAQRVDFDEVFARVLRLVAEVAAAQNTTAHTRTVGKFGSLPSQYATPLALALTEVVTNAVEHGLAGQEGQVEIIAERTERSLSVRVRDSGSGLPDGQVGRGLGTQIVRTLIQGELSGTIAWEAIREPQSPFDGGTEVRIVVPLRWISS